MVTLAQSKEAIFKEYQNILTELTEVHDNTPEDFETIAHLSGKAAGIKYMIDLLSTTTIPIF